MSARMQLMDRLIQETRKTTHNCPSCDQHTYCAVMDGKSGNLCWCFYEPIKGNISTDVDVCLCKTCLVEESGE